MKSGRAGRVIPRGSPPASRPVRQPKLFAIEINREEKSEEMPGGKLPEKNDAELFLAFAE